MKYKKILIVIIIIFIAGISGSLWVIFRPHEQTVNVIQNGKILYTINLETAENQNIEVEYQGRKNIIRIENHEIFMSEADCPDHTCIKTGKLSDYPIVCLPNKLVIEFAENNETDAEVR